MEKIHYKGKGEHSVNSLETICEQLTEELYQLRIVSKPLPLSEDKINKLKEDATVEYVKQLHNQDRCIGFIDGIEKGLSLKESDCKVSEEEIKQDFKELNVYLNDLCLQTDKDSGHLWIAFTDKFNAFEKRILSLSPQPKEVKEPDDKIKIAISIQELCDKMWKEYSNWRNGSGQSGWYNMDDTFFKAFFLRYLISSCNLRKTLQPLSLKEQSEETKKEENK